MIQLVQFDVGLDFLLSLGKYCLVALLQQGKSTFQVRPLVRRPGFIETDGLPKMVHSLLLLIGSMSSLLVDLAQPIVGSGIIRANRDGFLKVLACFVKQIIFEGEHSVVSLYGAHQKVEIRRGGLETTSTAFV